MMGKIKDIFELIVALDKLNKEINDGLNDRIKALKQQVKEEEKNPKYWNPESQK